MTAENFWARVLKTDTCWLWTGGICAGGYGGASPPGGSQTTAHRVSWILTFGPIPDGLSVLHKCDNRPCVRPDHLFLGTQKQNIDDMIAKGRAALGAALNHPPQIGSLNHGSKLTDDLVIQIKKRGLMGARPSDIRDEFGIPRANAWAILRGKSWKHIEV